MQKQVASKYYHSRAIRGRRVMKKKHITRLLRGTEVIFTYFSSFTNANKQNSN